MDERGGGRPLYDYGIGGWSSLKILERYLHRTRSERQSAVNKLDGVLNSRNIHENANILELKSKIGGR